MKGEQLLLFGFSRDHAATWSPRDLWLRLDGAALPEFVEDNRLERKSGKTVHFDALAEYASMWSNTVEGGILLIGVENDGKITGCAGLTQDKLNRLDSFHTQSCPDAAPQSRRIPVIIDGNPDFVVAIYFPYRGFLVETNKHDAFIRRGDNKHKMSPEEKDDFRSTRHERSWEQRIAGVFEYPGEFDATVINEFCQNFRDRESKDEWSNEAILIDRQLATKQSGKFVALNCLVLFAAKQPRSWSEPLQVDRIRLRF